MHDVQRIAGLPHVQPGERAPGAADGVEGAALAALEQARAAKRLLDDLLGLLERLSGTSCSASPPSGSVTPGLTRCQWTSVSSSEPPPRSPTMPSGWWKPETTPSAESSASRLPEMTSISVRQMRSRLGDEGLAVLGVAAGRGREHPDLVHLDAVAERAEPAQRRQRLVDRIGGQQPGRLHLAAEPAQHLLVEDRRRAARQPLVDHEPHRVRADVDDGDRRAVVEAALRLLHGWSAPLKRGRGGV